MGIKFIVKYAGLSKSDLFSRAWLGGLNEVLARKWTSCPFLRLCVTMMSVGSWNLHFLTLGFMGYIPTLISFPMVLKPRRHYLIVGNRINVASFSLSQ